MTRERDALPTMVRFFHLSDGKPIRESRMWLKSKRRLAPPRLAHSWNG